MTLFRLWLRRGRYWWDDAWAFFSLLKYVLLTTTLLRFPHTLLIVLQC